MPKTLSLLVFLSFFFSHNGFSDQTQPGSTDTVSTSLPVMAFDLGQTLIGTGEFVREDNAFSELWYLEGVEEHLKALKAAGYPLIMIINVPDFWGGDPSLPVAERQQIKLQTLKDSVALSWQRTERNPPGSYFDWELFDHIVLPMSDADRKKNGVLSMYWRARAWANQVHFTDEVIYQTEDATEVCEALEAGLFARQVTNDREFHLLLPEVIPAFTSSESPALAECLKEAI